MLRIAERAVFAVLFLAVALAFSSAVEIQFTLPKLFWLRALLILLIVVWLIKLHRGQVAAPPPVILAGASALAVWWIVTSVTAVDPVTAIYGAHGRYNGLITHLTLLGLFLIAASLRASRRDIEYRLTLFAAALVPVALLALAQDVGLDSRAWPNPRPAATIGHPVPLAAILTLVVPFALVFAITATTMMARWIWWTVLALNVAAVVATLSRGPWAGLAVAAAIVAAGAMQWGLLRVNRRVVAGVGAVFLFFVLTGTSTPMVLLRARLQSLARLELDPSFMNRFVYFDAAARMLRDRPMLGVGFENYGLLYPRYRPIEAESVPIDEMPTKVHNGYLERAVMNGVPGLVLYLSLAVSVMLLLWRTFRRRAGAAATAAAAREGMLGLAFVAAIAGYLFQDLSGWQEISLSVFVWMLLGTAVAYCAPPDRARRRPTASWRVAGSVAAVLAVVALVRLAGSSRDELRADRLFFEASARDIATEWPRIDADVTAGLAFAPASAHFADAAGVLHLRRFAAAGERGVYERAVRLIEGAAAQNSFDPYILVHRIDLETVAVQRKAVLPPSSAVDAAIARLIELDPNNATVHESVARYRLAEGRADAALAAIARAIRLRPAHARYHLLEGDVRRMLKDNPGTVAAYRAEVAMVAPDQPTWLEASRKLVLALIEAGDPRGAVEQAQAALQHTPDDSLLHTLEGVAQLGLQAREPAMAAFEKALAVDPANAGARQGLIEAQQLRPNRGGAK